MTEKLIKRRAVCEQLGGISSTTLWRWVRSGSVPPPRKVAPHGDNVWLASEIDEVIQSLRVADAYADCGTDAAGQDAALIQKCQS